MKFMFADRTNQDFVLRSFVSFLKEGKVEMKSGFDLILLKGLPSTKCRWG